MKWHGYAFVAAVAAVIIVIVSFPSDKKRIKKVIRTSEEAVISEDVKALMSRVSFNYADDYSGSYLVLKKRVERLFNTYDDFEVNTDIFGITVTEDEAVADVKVSLIASSGTERGYLIGDAGRRRDIKIFFEKSKLGWMITGLDAFIEKEHNNQLH